VAVAPDGSVIVVGSFATLEEGGTLSLGEASIESDGLTGFVTRYDADGELHWLRALSNGFRVQPHRVAAGADGSVVVTGLMSRDGLEIDGLSARCDVARCAFVAKVDVGGAVRRLTPFWGTGEVRVAGVTPAPWGYLVWGTHLCSLHIGDEEHSSRACRGGPLFASFVARVDHVGDILSVTLIEPEAMSSVAVHDAAQGTDGRFAVSMTAFGSLSIDSTEIAPETPLSIAAWSSMELEPWSWPLGSVEDGVYPSDIAWLGDDIAVVGRATGRFALDGVEITADDGDPLSARRSEDRLQWSRVYAGRSDHSLTDLTVTDDGGLVVAGSAAGNTDLGSGPIAPGPGRGIVAGLDGRGRLVWQHVVAGDGSVARAVASGAGVVAVLEEAGESMGAVRLLVP